MNRYQDNRWMVAGLVALSASIVGGCATSQKDASEMPVSGPVVLNPRSVPDKVELNRFLQPKEPQQFFVEIQDLSAPIVEAKIQLNPAGRPVSSDSQVEVPLQRIGGTTWHGELNADQLKRLAVSGQTVKYEGQVVARNQNGVVGTSKGNVEIALTTPLFAPGSG